MTAKVLICNVNHAAHAQDLFLHNMEERDCALGVITEPYRIPPNHSRWTTDTLSSVTILWRDGLNYAPANPVHVGVGFVAINWGCLSIVGLYLPPSLSFIDYENGLTCIAAYLRRNFPRPTIITGDFNAKSVMWGSPRTDRRGAAVELWAQQLGLMRGNRSSSKK